MKKLYAILLCLFVLAELAGCAESKVIDGKVYETYGIFNKDEVKSDNIRYHLVAGNLVWSVLLFETGIAPIYFIGFDLYEPVDSANQE